MQRAQIWLRFAIYHMYLWSLSARSIVSIAFLSKCSRPGTDVDGLWYFLFIFLFFYIRLLRATAVQLLPFLFYDTETGGDSLALNL